MMREMQALEDFDRIFPLEAAATEAEAPGNEPEDDEDDDDDDLPGEKRGSVR
jgi:hypothetical protein